MRDIVAAESSPVPRGRHSAVSGAHSIEHRQLFPLNHRPRVMARWIVVLRAALFGHHVVAQQPLPTTSTGPNGHTMVIIRGGEFTMGSPAGERGRTEDETSHRVRIPRTYAIATTGSPTSSSPASSPLRRRLARDGGRRYRTVRRPSTIAVFSRTPDSPQVAVSWYDAAQYCNWLSERDGLPATEWVYPKISTPRKASGFRRITSPHGISPSDRS